MREEKDFKKIAEKRLSPMLGDISKEIKSEFPEMFKEDERQNSKAARTRKKAVFGTLAALAAVAACCAVILPCALLLPREDTGGTHYAPSAPSDPWDVSGASPAPGFTVEKTELTIKQYNERYGTNILYLDVYETADLCETKLYIGLEGEVFCIEERTESEDVTAALAAEKIGSNFNIVGAYENKCTKTEQLKNCEIKYAVDGANVFGVFEFGSMQYLLTLENETHIEKLFEFTEKLFENS